MNASTGPPPTQHHNHMSVDDRAQRQKIRLREKLHQRQHQEKYYPVNHIPTSPRRTKGKGALIILSSILSCPVLSFSVK